MTTVMSVTFQLDGQEFFALNGGPHFKFTPAISFFVDCKTQQEVDELWENSPPAGKNKDAAGYKINIACRGRSFPLSWASCYMTLIRLNRQG